MQGFEFTHELAWNLLKDYLRSAGRDRNHRLEKCGALRFQEWFDQCGGRGNADGHDQGAESQLAHLQSGYCRGNRCSCAQPFYPFFEQLARTFSGLAAQDDSE